jgi:hypothetical protein
LPEPHQIANSLELAFASLLIRDICLNPHIARETLSEADCVALQGRLSDLAAVVSAEEFQILHSALCQPSADGNGFRVKLFHVQLVCVPAHLKMPTDGDGLVDWSAVKRVKIVSLEKINA